MRPSPAIAATVLLGLAGCGPRFSPPAADAAGLDVARGMIASAPPSAGVAVDQVTAEAVLIAVSGRLIPATQPLCMAYLHETCAFRVTLDPSATARAAMS